MDFPLHECMDEEACQQRLIKVLHPDGLCCPRCGSRSHFGVHRCELKPRPPTYRCRQCKCVFNAWTGTALEGTRRPASQWILILRGFAQGVSTSQLARELACDRKHLLELRHKLQERAAAGLDRRPLPDAILEADELYQNAGEKRETALRSPGSSATARKRPPGARHVRQRPAAGDWSGRPHQRTRAAAGGRNR
jgi:transposase-like protein